MQNTLITSQEFQLIEMFQVEELEQRLENKWGGAPDECSVSTKTDVQTGSTTVECKATWKF